jgi:hypothetical protein
MDPISQAFVDAMGRFAEAHELDVVSFRKGERKDEVTARVKVVVASVMQPTVEYGCRPTASL